MFVFKTAESNDWGHAGNSKATISITLIIMKMVALEFNHIFLFDKDWIKTKTCSWYLRWRALFFFGILGRVNFVCLNAHHDENASCSTCSLIRKAAQMAFFDRELINPSIPWVEMHVLIVEEKRVLTFGNAQSCF